MSLVKVNQSNQSDKLRVGPSIGATGNWVRWVTGNSKTLRKPIMRIMEIAGRDESPNRGIMEHKNMLNGGEKIITFFFVFSSHSLRYMP